MIVKWTLDFIWLAFDAVVEIILGSLQKPFLLKNVSVTSTNMELKGRVVVYSITGCPHCIAAKNVLQEKNLPYVDVNMDTFPQCLNYIQTRTGKGTVPQIFFNNIHVGGNADLQKAVSDYIEWERLLKEVKYNAPTADAPVPPDPETAVVLATHEFICEPDEYASLVFELKASGLITNHSTTLVSNKNTFKGKEFVEWMVKTKKMERTTAIMMGQMLIDKHFGHQVKDEEEFKDDDTLYRLLEDEESTALNGGAVSNCEQRPASELGEDLRRQILKIYSAYLSKDGKSVNYEAIAESQEFKDYVEMTSQLTRVDVENVELNDKIAFFINVYNALVIHANVVKGPPRNLWQRYKFFNTVRYVIGGLEYSLQDIENGVLRGNRKGVGMLTKPFSRGDPRLKIALDEPEPKIHFALVCGAKSCPPIKTYSPKGLQEQLHLAAVAFLEGEDGCVIDTSKKEVKLSQIFKWYKADFGGTNKLVLDFVYAHMGPGSKKEELEKLLGGTKMRLNHLSYDWSLNSK